MVERKLVPLGGSQTILLLRVCWLKDGWKEVFLENTSHNLLTKGLLVNVSLKEFVQRAHVW